jgi:hypothetical protein
MRSMINLNFHLLSTVTVFGLFVIVARFRGWIQTFIFVEFRLIFRDVDQSI